MKNNTQKSASRRVLKVKEISDGVYINLNRITTDEKEFGEAIEESFKELEKEEILKSKKENSAKSNQSNPD